MNTEIGPISAVSPVSLAKIDAPFYAAVGLVMLIAGAVIRTPIVTVPLGFVVPLLYLTVNLHFPLALSLPGILLQITFSTALFALTGYLSGLVCSVFYNLMSKHLGVRIYGSYQRTEIGSSEPFDKIDRAATGQPI